MSQRPTPEGCAGAELPDLTDRQYEFVRHILAGESASEAYRRAYDASGMQQRTIWAAASRLRADAKVSAWIAAGRVAHLGTAVLTKEGHMQELERLKELAIKAGQLPSAVQAEVARGRVAGHHVDQVTITARADPVSALEAIAVHSPEYAAQLAAKYEIPWDNAGSATKH